MRKLILILLLAVSITALSQNDTTKYFASPDYGWNYKRIKARLALILPSDTSQNKLIGSLVSISGEIYKKSQYSWDKIQSTPSLMFANVRDYGAVGDGSTDDRAAFSSALSSGKPVVVPFGKYFLSSTIQLSYNQQLLGFGDSSIVYVNGDYAAFSIRGSGVHVESIRLKGTGRKSTTDYATTQPNQHGIYLNNTVAVTSQFSGIVIDKVSFDSLGGGGFYGYYNVSAPAKPNVTISNSRAYKCWAGFYTERAEYIALSNYSADSCEYGAYVKAGNVYFSEPMIVNNKINFYLKKIANDAHGTVLGGGINHGVKFNIYIDSIGLGYDFTGVNIYAGQIRITQSEGVRFNGGAIAVDSLNISGSTNISFNKSYFYSTPIINTSYGGSASTVTFFEPIWYATAATGTMIRNGSTFYSTAAYSANRLLGNLDFAHKAYVDSSVAGRGTVTSISTNSGSGITGGPITSSGTIAADTSILSTKANVTALLLGKLGLTGGSTITTVGTLSSGSIPYSLLTGTPSIPSVSGTTNYLPKFTGTSTLGNSGLTDDGTTVTFNSRALNGTSAAFSGTGSFGNSAANYQLNVYKAGAVDSYIQVTSGGGGNGSGNGLLLGVDASGNGWLNMQGGQNFTLKVAGLNRWAVNQSTGVQSFTNGVVNFSSRVNVNGAADNSLFSLNNGGGTFYTNGFSPNATTYSTTQTLGTGTTYIFNGGSGITWTLPNPSGNNQMYFIKNASSNTLTLAAFAANQIIDLANATQSSISIAAGAVVIIQQDGNSKSYILK